MELSNIRASAVKKAKLMFLSLQNLTQYQSSLHTNLFGNKRDKTKTKDEKKVKSEKKRKKKRKIDEDPERMDSNMRLTRGSLANSSATPVKSATGSNKNLQQVRVQSVFDLPCVGNLKCLFEDLDEVLLNDKRPFIFLLPLNVINVIDFFTP